jgi:hypothetical protein
MEPEGSLPYSQVPAPRPYTKKKIFINLTHRTARTMINRDTHETSVYFFTIF